VASAGKLQGSVQNASLEESGGDFLGMETSRRRASGIKEVNKVGETLAKHLRGVRRCDDE
jgi:hypothetical protein